MDPAKIFVLVNFALMRYGQTNLSMNGVQLEKDLGDNLNSPVTQENFASIQLLDEVPIPHHDDSLIIVLLSVVDKEIRKICYFFT